MAKNDPQDNVQDNKQEAIVDAVASLLLIVSNQIRAIAPETATNLLVKRENLLNGVVPAKDDNENGTGGPDKKTPAQVPDPNANPDGNKDPDPEKVDQK